MTHRPPRRRSGGPRRWIGLASVSLVLGACSTPGPAISGGTPSSSAPLPFATLIRAGITLSARGDVNGALQLFEQAVKSNPASPLGYYNLGVVYQHEGETVQAVTNYNHALYEDPSYVPALYNKALVYASSDPQRAMRLYRKIVALKPQSSTALLNLGLLEIVASGMKAQGVTDLRKAVQLDPSLLGSIPASLRAQVQAS